MNSTRQSITKKKRGSTSTDHDNVHQSSSPQQSLITSSNGQSSSPSPIDVETGTSSTARHRSVVSATEKATINARLEERRKLRRDQRTKRKRRQDNFHSRLSGHHNRSAYFRSRMSILLGCGFGLILLAWFLAFLYLARDMDLESRNVVSPLQLKNRLVDFKNKIKEKIKRPLYKKITLTDEQSNHVGIDHNPGMQVVVYDGSGVPNLKGDPNNIVDMRILNQELPFANPNGGVWTQGWDVQPVELTKDKPLRIFVLPHSHCDPGWIKTFDDYFQTQTKDILTSVVESLLKDPKRKFIWAEISYFEWWWREQTPERQADFKKLLNTNQFEFVTGGWVQPDEANTQLYAMEIQLEEGHDFIRTTFGSEYIPKYGWSIDPFGYSPTMAYLLKKHGFKAMLIQRVHYAIKKELALHKNLEFMWRQTWDDTGDYDILTHVMPFYSYDVPHTCGPDPSVCCQFDFARMNQNGIADYVGVCPWHKQPKIITPKNVKERSLMLLDQYRKKANLYRTNVVLAPLGDDFRYRTVEEADLQFENYQAMFDYINKEVDNVEISFGTLSDYFETVMIDRPFSPPLLKGSFFTYADREEDYWSGYFTSRIFDKALDRQLERVLYAASSLGATKTELQGPRRALSLFQHHDGVTGTAKHEVVEDYAKRIHEAISETQNWILQHLMVDNDHGRSHGLAKKLKIQACWQSNAPRGLSQNLCEQGGDSKAKVIVYNPLETEQSCGSTIVPGGTIAHARLPCETPGILPENDHTDEQQPANIRFDPHTGLMTHPVREEWMVWKVKQGGAYLFFPGKLQEYSSHMGLDIQQGGAIVTTKYWNRTVVERRLPSDIAGGGIVIDFIYTTNLTINNDEWFARFTKEDIHNGGVFHTDLNGYNFDTHHYRSDMPIQSQVFPMPTLASIEDAGQRMTVLSEHAQGTASLEEGSIDIWLDRRLNQDDNRGLQSGVKDNVPTRTRLRVVLEKPSPSKATNEFEITTFCKRQWKELNHPLEMFGAAGVTSSNPFVNRLKGVPEIDSIELDNRPMKDRLEANAEAGSIPDEIAGQYNIAAVYMVYKRVDYLKQAIDSLRQSDYPKSMPVIISHDGHIPEIVDYVNSLKSEFRIRQVFHPYACHDHPGAFPSDDPKLNENYAGDSFGNKRDGSITCCKHHFSWLMNHVFTLRDLKGIDGFLFLEEDYIVAPTVYKTIYTGFKYIDSNNRRKKFFGLALDATAGYAFSMPKANWIVAKFITGPMAIRRDIFKKIKKHAKEFCEWDDYNWDWSIVHLMAMEYLPFKVLAPGVLQAAHIGMEGGMHDGIVADPKRKAIMDQYVPDDLKLEKFVEDVGVPHKQRIKPPSVKEAGFGGWGHPADQEHCKRIFAGQA